MAAFQQLLKDGEGSEATIEQLEQAVGLYRGPFLEGFSIPDSVPFEEWVSLKREGLVQQVLTALRHLVSHYQRQRAYERALPYAWRGVELAPWQEEGYRQLMTLLALSGRRGEALRQYERCRATLAQELGVEPAPETEQLYEQIRSGALGEVSEASQPRHNLPSQTTPFIGREGELAQLANLVADPERRLITIVGAGGMGKTRLALEAALAQIGHFRHGIFFVPLGGLDASTEIVPAIAEAVGFTFYQGMPPDQQLLAYLNGKTMLLLLDNFEHLLSGANLVADILQAAPQVKLLITSRARLNLAAEQIYPLAGLAYPAANQLEAAQDFQAIQLFAERAGRARPNFALTAGNLAAVSRICELVAGLPLAIILASAWVGLLDPEEIAAEIEQGLDVLASEARDLPARQRSIRAVFDHSWRLLTAAEQAVLRQLSVFRGHFTRQAAQAVTGCTLRTLLNLVDTSHLQRTIVGDFQMHELLRQYAGEQLQQSAAEETEARDRHSVYYLAYLAEREVDLKGRRQLAAFGELIAAADNIRAAWQWAARHGRHEWFGPTIEAMGLFYEWRCHCAEGASLYQQALEGLVPSDKAWSDPPPELASCLISLVAWQATFRDWLGDTEACDTLYDRGLALLSGSSSDAQGILVAKAYLLLAYAFRVYERDGVAQAREVVAESLALYQTLKSRWGIAQALFLLAYISEQLGDTDMARLQYEESLSSAEALGNDRLMQLALQGLGFVALRQQHEEEGERLLLQACQLAHRYGSPRNIGIALSTLGHAYLFLGRFTEACQPFETALASNQAAGHKVDIDWSYHALSELMVHLGEYEQAHRYLQQLSSQESRVLAAAACTRGAIALAQGQFAEAARQYKGGLDLIRLHSSPDRRGDALVGLAHSAWSMGEYERAWQVLWQARQNQLAAREPLVSLQLLTIMALLLADQGEVVQAVELYALASRYPYVANSQWFEDVAGRRIVAAAATLPADVVAAAKRHGQAQDLSATIEKLLSAVDIST